MKKAIYIVLAFCLIPLASNAQKFEITPQYGYQIGAKYHFYGGYVKMTDSDQFGVTLNMKVNRDVEAEFIWAQQNATIRIEDYIYNPDEVELTSITVNHYQIGGIHPFAYDGVIPFAGASLGWSTFSPDNNFYASNTKFSIGVSGGMKYFMSDRIGIRLQGQLLMPIQWGGVYIGSGGSSVSTGGSLMLLNFSGGLIFAFGN